MNARGKDSFLIALLLRALPQGLVLVAIGAAAGFALNQTRLDPLPLNLPSNLLLTESGAQVIFLGKARQLFEEGNYIFVDARPQQAFLEQHIEGAFSLPLEHFARLHLELQAWTAGQPILIYGRAAASLVPDDLARQLQKAGEEQVAMLAVGFEAWRDRGYPVESGPEGLLSDEDSWGSFPDDLDHGSSSAENP
ncbi:MAG: rhodanese-like domain-containing protein [Candidatus Eisenbacteria sp.]|nr:rhodanese-like domain-containing protein [Candidatus Eisenbacteria bacterium]